MSLVCVGDLYDRRFYAKVWGVGRLEWLMQVILGQMYIYLVYGYFFYQFTNVGEVRHRSVIS